MMSALSLPQMAIFEIDTEHERGGRRQQRTWLIRASNVREAMSFMPDGTAIRSVSLMRAPADGAAGVVGWLGDQITHAS